MKNGVSVVDNLNFDFLTATQIRCVRFQEVRVV